jgi:hypothetical protein
MFAAEKSTRGNTCAQVFTNGNGYSLFYPLEKKGLAHRALTKTIQDVGIMKDLTVDGAGELNDKSLQWGKIVKEHRINQRTTELYSPWQNRAEAEIREIKKGIRRATRRTGSPYRLWDYCGQWVSAIRRLTAHDITSLDGRVPAELIEGNTPDISEYAQFDWYEPVWYKDPAIPFPKDNRRLGRWIGVAHDAGAPLTSWVLPASGRPVARSTVSSFTAEDKITPSVQGDLAELDRAIEEKIGNQRPSKEVEKDFNALHPIIPDDIYLPEQEDETVPYDPDATMPEADDYTSESYDKYLAAEVMLPAGGELLRARATARSYDLNGKPIGKSHSNPILDTRQYEVKFPDGSSDAFGANVIAESMYSQIDDEGHSFQILKEIIDHKSDGNAVSSDDGFTEEPDGAPTPRRTTKGWKLLVQWKDGTSSCGFR